MADNDVNEAGAELSRVSIEDEEVEDDQEDGEEENPPELVREPSTSAVAKIVNELALLSLDELREVQDAVNIVIQNKTKPLPKHYVNWCAARDKWMGMPKPKDFARTVNQLGPDVPTYTQWRQWNDPEFDMYIGDKWSVVDGKPVKKK